MDYTFKRLQTGEVTRLVTGLPGQRQWHGSHTAERGWTGAFITRRFAAQLIGYYRRVSAQEPALFALRRRQR